MEHEDIAQGFVHWVGTFSKLSKPVSTLSDLSDGIVLFEICSEIDRHWFKSIRSADMGDNWVLGYNNLKKLYRLVTQFYEEILGYPATRLAEPNLSAIAKNNDTEELLKLCHLILTLAVQCEKNQVYIGKIMSLGEDDQRSLMVSIESVLAQLGSVDNESDNDNHDMEVFDAQHHDEGIDPVAKLQAELMKSYAEKDELEKSARELSNEHKQVQSKYEELLVLNEELKMRMEDLEHSIAMADKSGRADFLLRAEIDNLKHDLEKAELRAQESENIMKDQQSAITDMTRKLADRDAANDEAVRLRDQLQEYKHAAERLAKSEHVIEKYKKKLEESADLRRQVRTLEEQYAKAQDRTRQIEDEFHKISSRRPVMDDVRDGYQQLESQHNLTVIELSQAMERLRKAEDERDRIAADRQHDQEQIQALEEQLREIELSGGNVPVSTANTLDKGLAMDTDDDRTELLTKIARLERELKAARDAPPQTDAADFLEEVADNATREKDAALQQLEAERTARSRLERQLAEHAESVPRLKSDLDTVSAQLMAATTEAGQVRNDLAATKEELEKARAAMLTMEQERKVIAEAGGLRDENMSLEDRLAETHQGSQKFEQEIARLTAANRELTQKLGHMQEELTRLEIALREAGGQSSNDVDRLQRELLKSREEVHVLQVSLKRTKDHCVVLDQKLQAHQQTVGAPQESLQAAQAQLALKEEQLESVRTMLREQNNTHLLESRTMASAWFNLQRQLERQSGFGHSSGMGSLPSARQAGTPASWLSQQRVTLDMQLSGA